MAGNTEEAVARLQTEAANVQGVQKHTDLFIILLSYRSIND